MLFGPFRVVDDSFSLAEPCFESIEGGNISHGGLERVILQQAIAFDNVLLRFDDSLDVFGRERLIDHHGFGEYLFGFQQGESLKISNQFSNLFGDVYPNRSVGFHVPPHGCE